MRPGLFLPNYPLDQWQERDWRVVDAVRAASYLVLAREYDGSLYTALEERGAKWGRRPLYIVRLDPERKTSEGSLEALVAARERIPVGIRNEGRVLYVIGANPDKPEEWPAGLAAYSQAVAYVASRSGEKVVTANLCDNARHPELAEAIKWCAGVGVEAYGANGDPALWEWARETGKPVYILETGTLLYRGAERATWQGWRYEQYAGLGAETAIWFIGGGRSYDAWDEGYILSEDEAAGYGAVVERLLAKTPEPLPKPAPVPEVPAASPWLDAWGEWGGLAVRDVRPHFPEIGGQYERRAISEIDEFVVHHSTGDVPADASGALRLLESIDRYHRTEANFCTKPGEVLHAPCIAYCGAISAGDVWLTNDPVVVGWAQGPHNRRGLAFCWLGDFSDREPPQEYLEQTVRAWRAAEAVCGRKLALIGHQEAMPGQTICPSRLWPQIKQKLMAMKEGPAMPTEPVTPAPAPAPAPEPTPVPADPPACETLRPMLDKLWERAQILRQEAADHVAEAEGLEAFIIDVKRQTGFPD